METTISKMLTAPVVAFDLILVRPEKHEISPG
jgi:hypothetical protein